MMRGFLNAIRGRLGKLRAELQPGGVHYVADPEMRWALYWVARYVTENLRAAGVPIRMTSDPWPLRRRIIHFGNRYAFFRGPWRELCERNDVFLTWFHGEPDDPGFADLLARMPEAAAMTRGVVTS